MVILGAGLFLRGFDSFLDKLNRSLSCHKNRVMRLGNHSYYSSKYKWLHFTVTNGSFGGFDPQMGSVINYTSKSDILPGKHITDV